MSDPREAQRERDLLGWLADQYREHVPQVRAIAPKATAR